MNEASFPRGVWPVMLTPFADAGEIDWTALDALVEWYIDSGVAGLFSVCLSSEMYQLTPEERVKVAGHVVNRANGRVPVVAAGAFGDTIDRQAEAARRIEGTGVQAVVLTANQLAPEGDPETTWQRNAEAFMQACPEMPLGLYECPRPHHRTLSPELLGWCARTGRFHFLKDTCCTRSQIEAKLKAIEGTPLRWFNAHCPSVLYSLGLGGDGYSGIAANAYAHLFAWLCRHATDRPEKAERVQQFLTLADPTIRLGYPASAKRYLAMLGLPITPTCRTEVPPTRRDDDQRMLLENLRRWVDELTATLG